MFPFMNMLQGGPIPMDEPGTLSGAYTRVYAYHILGGIAFVDERDGKESLRPVGQLTVATDGPGYIRRGLDEVLHSDVLAFTLRATFGMELAELLHFNTGIYFEDAGGELTAVQRTPLRILLGYNTTITPISVWIPTYVYEGAGFGHALEIATEGLTVQRVQAALNQPLGEAVTITKYEQE